MYPWSGGTFGSVSIPRVGTEVIVDFVNGDPDRPIVVGQMYNAMQMPPWQLPRNQALAGYRSQEFGSLQANSLVFDDTQGKIQAQLSSDEGQSQLSLGYITRIAGNAGRQEARGRGFELATQLWGVVRSAMGMLITTDASQGQVKDMAAPLQRLTQARQQHEDMAGLAREHQAQDELPPQSTQKTAQKEIGQPGFWQVTEVQAEKTAEDLEQELTAQLNEKASQQQVTKTIKTQNDALKGGASNRENPFPELARPDLVIAGAAGVAVTAADSTHLTSQNDHSVTAGRDVSLSIGRSLLAVARNAVSLFAYNLGMKLIAAKGKVQIQAQGDEMDLAALKDLSIRSVGGKVIIAAEKEVWIGSGGSYIRINGSGIMNGTPGQIFERCASFHITGPDTSQIPLGAFPPGYQSQYVLVSQESGQPKIQCPYQLKLPSGHMVSGVTDGEGETRPVFTSAQQQVQLYTPEVKKHETQPWYLAGGGPEIYADYTDN